MFDVRTDHKIVAGAEHLMQIQDSATLGVIISATRDPGTLEWTIHAENGGATDLIAPTVVGSPTPRSEVISAMVNMALEVSSNNGYSTICPHGLLEIP